MKTKGCVEALPLWLISRVALPMAEPSQIEGRLRLVLTVGRNRARVSRRLLVVILPVSVGLLMTLGEIKAVVQVESTASTEAPKPVTALERDDVKGPVRSVLSQVAPLRLQKGRWVEGPREFFQETFYDEDQKLTKWVFHTDKPGGRTVTLYGPEPGQQQSTEYLPNGAVFTTHAVTYNPHSREATWTGEHADGTSGRSTKTTYDPATREEISTSYDAQGHVTQRDITKKDQYGNVVGNSIQDANGHETNRYVGIIGSDRKMTEEDNYLNGTLISRVIRKGDAKHGILTVFWYEAEIGPRLEKPLSTSPLNFASRLHAVTPLRLTRKEVVVHGLADAYGNYPRSVTYEWALRNGRLVPVESTVWYRTITYSKRKPASDMPM